MVSMKNLIALIALLLALQFVSAACDLNIDCDLDQQCVDSKCIDLDCGECASLASHDCVPKKRGICCTGYWNPKFSSCEISYSFVEGIVSRTNDDRASHFFDESMNAMDIGWIERAVPLLESAELSAYIAQSQDDFNEDVHELIDQEFEQAQADIDNNKFSEVERVFSKIRRIQKTMIKPVVVITPTPVGPNDPGTALPSGEEVETPWLVIIVLVIALVVLFIVLIVFMKGKSSGGTEEKEETAESLGITGTQETAEEGTTKWFD